MRFKATVQVWLREGIADPEGHTISEAIHALGYSDVDNVRMGKVISLEIEAESLKSAQESADKISTSLLSNPVLEDVLVYVEEAS